LTDRPIGPGPRGAGHGCLWGCLIAGAIAIAVVVATMSYTGWWLFSGFRTDPALHTVMETVNSDRIARAVLGDNIEITSLASSSVTSDTATGTHASYVARVKGSKAEGMLAITLDRVSGRTHVTSVVLTGPDGGTYDLTTSQPVPPPGSI
jgi:cytochrome oxidase complex assembly protein 1